MLEEERLRVIVQASLEEWRKFEALQPSKELMIGGNILAVRVFVEVDLGFSGTWNWRMGASGNGNTLPMLLVFFLNFICACMMQ